MRGLKIGWKPRAFPVGTDLKAVRNGLKIYKARNIRREDFDMGKIKPESGMAVAAWADSCFALEGGQGQTQH